MKPYALTLSILFSALICQGQPIYLGKNFESIWADINTSKRQKKASNLTQQGRGTDLEVIQFRTGIAPDAVIHYLSISNDVCTISAEFSVPDFVGEPKKSLSELDIKTIAKRYDFTITKEEFPYFHYNLKGKKGVCTILASENYSPGVVTVLQIYAKSEIDLVFFWEALGGKNYWQPLRN
ncbi:MAG: hypothetical protein KDD01_07500 [Phaeodactylibacter sp.]|nr:hypothetical protein [Phaeodactylibacter sp.]